MTRIFLAAVPIPTLCFPVRAEICRQTRQALCLVLYHATPTWTATPPSPPPQPSRSPPQRALPRWPARDMTPHSPFGHGFICRRCQPLHPLTSSRRLPHHPWLRATASYAALFSLHISCDDTACASYYLPHSPRFLLGAPPAATSRPPSSYPLVTYLAFLPSPTWTLYFFGLSLLPCLHHTHFAPPTTPHLLSQFLHYLHAW